MENLIVTTADLFSDGGEALNKIRRMIDNHNLHDCVDADHYNIQADHLARAILNMVYDARYDGEHNGIMAAYRAIK